MNHKLRDMTIKDCRTKLSGQIFVTINGLRGPGDKEAWELKNITN